jgi:hypothetical protein
MIVKIKLKECNLKEGDDITLIKDNIEVFHFTFLGGSRIDGFPLFRFNKKQFLRNLKLEQLLNGEREIDYTFTNCIIKEIGVTITDNNLEFISLVED